MYNCWHIWQTHKLWESRIKINIDDFPKQHESVDLVMAKEKMQLNAELHPICHLLALLGTHHILHVSTIRVTRQVSK